MEYLTHWARSLAVADELVEIRREVFPGQPMQD
jgi:hypothetical protein